MDNAIHVQKEQENSKYAEYQEQHRHILADINNVSRVLQSFKELEESVAWMDYYALLIEPAKEKVKKEIAELNSSLKDHPDALGKLIYQNAFHDVLATITDLPALRKKWSEEFRRLEGRRKDLENKLKLNHA
jgi:hypothetical protein